VEILRFWDAGNEKWEMGKDYGILFSPLTSHLSPPVIEIASSRAPRNDNVPGGNLPLSNYNKSMIIVFRSGIPTLTPKW